MPELPIFLTQWLLHYGVFALFSLLALGIIGLPIPDETLLAFAGFLLQQHKLSWPLTLLAAFAGAACGISVSYLLGRVLGNFIIHKYGGRIGITPAHLLRVQSWFDRFGKWAVFFGYFVPGVRHLTGYLAGSTRIPFSHFAAFAFTGALVWSATFIFLGYFFSHNWLLVTQMIGGYLWLLGTIILIAIILYLGWQILCRRYQVK